MHQVIFTFVYLESKINNNERCVLIGVVIHGGGEPRKRALQPRRVSLARGAQLHCKVSAAGRLLGVRYRSLTYSAVGNDFVSTLGTDYKALPGQVRCYGHPCHHRSTDLI